MKYIEQRRLLVEHQISSNNPIFNAGLAGGVFRKVNRPFVLINSDNNLFASLRGNVVKD